MNLNNSVGEYAALMADVAALAKYNLDCDTAREDALIDELHGGEEKRPTQAEKDRARANEPPMPRVDMNIELALLCAVGGNHDPFEETWDVLPFGVKDRLHRKHGEFVAACASGDWREIWEDAKYLADTLPKAADAAERDLRDGYTEEDRKRIDAMFEEMKNLKRMIANVSDAANTGKRKSASRRRSRNA